MPLPSLFGAESTPDSVNAGGQSQAGGLSNLSQIGAQDDQNTETANDDVPQAPSRSSSVFYVAQPVMEVVGGPMTSLCE
jgi:hypothetical protein